HAADAGADGNRKLDQAWRVGREEEGSGICGITLPLDRAALSVALGRENVVHLALTDRGAAERLAPLLGRLLHYLGQNGEDDSPAGRTVKGKPPVQTGEGADEDVSGAGAGDEDFDVGAGDGDFGAGADDELRLKGCLKP
ncbi:MAG TPA: hypothetical protein VN222_02790, partial [Novosphingobium sp.]|nr:hypothetical protein [Novosphingobium sp.]